VRTVGPSLSTSSSSPDILANAGTERTLSSCGMELRRQTKWGSRSRRFRWWNQGGTHGRSEADDEAQKLLAWLKGSELG
jgi:hypothetical protein